MKLLMQIWAGLWLGLALLSSQTQAAQPTYGPAWDEAYAFYLDATDGDRRATRESLERFTALQQQYPDDPIALTLMASSQTLRGRDVWLPWNKLSHTEDGLDNLMHAQRLLNASHDTELFLNTPVSLFVPMIAGINFVEVPAMFGRFEQGYELLLKASAHPGLAEAPEEVQAQVHFYTARSARAVDEHDRAEQALAHLFAVSLDHELSDQARAQLVQGD
ncbi:MAG: hypothetical protein WED11_12705 [Natronospirillum sp.]